MMDEVDKFYSTLGSVGFVVAMVVFIAIGFLILIITPSKDKDQPKKK